jgi:hypothetical protein
MTAQRPQLAHAIQSFVRPCLYIHTTWRRVQELDNVLLHSRFERCHLGAFQYQRDIDIANLVSISLHDFTGVLHELGGVASSPSWVRVLKDLTNIWKCESTKNGINDGMVYHIAIRMGDDPELGYVNLTLFDVNAFGVCPL